ncbi:MAG: DUF3501 family protein [Nitrosomonadales bacterium]|jgi:hypothetical protein|nr:MAG: hypothetical protein ABS06_06085 [Methylophilales bacterium BACL14 MAG-120910-bin43]KRP08291.1 MAG: hypothetical protein ABS29_01075 [Methylophilales bacterium BACL14 MAG-120920-bin58]MBT6392496.1 DUF3501 family protein [Nitrosomonadales bacterium]MDC0877481.1 DUF3501 family protein [Methylophilaceae bacterium]|tara:strand:- start:2310 stop:2891 length:582 start_codon:yes stop_codon:yes gene_type:complete
MTHLTRQDLFNLEKYAEIRNEFRSQVMAHKKNRRLALNDHAVIYFEDRMTMQYQIQEMLRIERIFEAEGIQQELEVYNTLIPDGSNWKATFMIEYGNVEERKNALTKLIGVERSVWFNVEGNEKVYAICNEDMDRETEDKTSAVHFMRFELSPSMVASAKVGLPITFGIDHPFYKTEMVIPPNIQQALIIDLK